VCNRGFSCFKADFLARSVGPIPRQRKVNGPGIFLNDARYARDIGFFDAPRLKLSGQSRQRRSVPGDNHDTRGIQIEPMHRDHARIVRVESFNQAISIERMPPRYAEEQRGFIYDEKVSIAIQNSNRFS